MSLSFARLIISDITNVTTLNTLSLGFIMSQFSVFRYSISKFQRSPMSAVGLALLFKCTSISAITVIKSPRLYFIPSLLLSVMFTLPNAQAASCKIPKSYYKNVSCTSSSGYFLAKKDFGAPVALIDSKGKPVVNLSRYDKVEGNKIAGGLIPVQRNSRVGYVNMQGQEVIPTMYNTLGESSGWARAVSDGRIIVKKNGQYGVISTNNQTIVPFSSSFSAIDNYRNGITKVRQNKSTSWLDKNGNTIADPNTKKETPAVKATVNNPSTSIPSQVAQPQPSAPVGFNTLQPQQQDGKWGFVDNKEVTMITYSFDEVKPFSEGLAGVRIDDKWGFINLGGELVIPFSFENSAMPVSGDYNGVAALVFTDNKAWYANLENGTKMCINKEGLSVSCD